MELAVVSRVSWAQVAAFRLKRHHLIHPQNSGLVEICADLCGVQAQVMGSARLAFRARTESFTRMDLESALWTRRMLVKTLAMRQTMHLLPAKDYSAYVAALLPSRTAALMRVMARIGVGAREVEGMNAALLQILSGDPMTQRELAALLKPRVEKKLLPWMNLSWNVFRPALIAGLVCYGPNRGRETTLVRVERWLPKLQAIDEGRAKERLLRNYLRTYAPAVLQDFCKWSGISVSEAKPLWRSLQDEMVAVSVEGAEAFVLPDQLPELESGLPDSPVVCLLPGFDPYLLAHARKEHLVSAQHYKRVYRSQGWISPVVLVNGRAAGVWSCKRQGRAFVVQTELFEKQPKAVLSAIKIEAEKVEGFANSGRD